MNSKNRWIQSYYPDLIYIFDTFLGLNFEPKFEDFVYKHSQTYVCLGSNTFYDVEENDVFNKIVIADLDISKKYKIYQDIINHTREYCPNVLSECSFTQFNEWTKSLK